MAAWGHMPRALFALDALFVLAAASAIVLLWRRRPDRRHWLVPAALFAVGLALCVDIHYMKPTGAAVIGWPPAWSVPMFPYPVLGSLGPRAAGGIRASLVAPVVVRT